MRLQRATVPAGYCSICCSRIGALGKRVMQCSSLRRVHNAVDVVGVQTNMRKSYGHLLLAVATLLAGAPLHAQTETAYVTDNLRLGMHQAPDTSDRAFRTLESGQELEILTRNRNYAQVVLPDGTQGYVKLAYLVFDKPAKLIVSETQAAIEQLQQELEATREQFAVPAATIAALEQQVSERQAALDDTTKKVSELSKENLSFKARQEKFQFSLPLAWVGGAMGVCLLAGFLVGLWWLDSRSRKRHGGIRIY